MYTGVFSFNDLMGIAAGIFFFIIIKYILTKKKTTWRYKIGEYIILTMIIWGLKSLVNFLVN